MAISNRLKSAKRRGLGCSVLAVRYSVLPVLTTKIHQAILHSITDIMAAAADVMDMDKDKAECTTSRILTVRRPRYRESEIAGCAPEKNSCVNRDR
jgi:hypothetical protein